MSSLVTLAVSRLIGDYSTGQSGGRKGRASPMRMLVLGLLWAVSAANGCQVAVGLPAGSSCSTTDGRSESDCSAALKCATILNRDGGAGCYVSQRICTISCATNSDCTAMEAGFVCDFACQQDQGTGWCVPVSS